MKLAEVLIIETRVVEEARVRADVKSAHIKALKARLSEKKTCRQQERVSVKIPPTVKHTYREDAEVDII